jgi:UDPglucose 6-dehydrogenase
MGAFRALDLARLKSVMARPIMVDLSNIYPPAEVAQHGFMYRSIGRPPAVGLEREAQRMAAE